MITCDCCDGKDRCDPMSLCGLCLDAFLAGEFPHGCDREAPVGRPEPEPK